MDRLPLPQEQEAGWDYNQYLNQTPRTSSSEATGAAWDIAQMDTGVGLLSRWKARRDFEALGAKPLDPDEANARYPGMPKPFREPIDPYVAQMLNDQNETKRSLENKIMAGPDDNWTKTKMFGAGVVAHLMDPLEFGAGAVTGWGVGGVLAKTAMGARLAEAGAAGKVAFSAVESLGGNVAQNVAQEGVIAANAAQEQQDYDIHDGISNALIGAAFGTMFHMGIKEGFAPAVGKTYSAGKNLARNLFAKTPEADMAIVRTIVSQAERDFNPDIHPIIKAIAKETDVRPDDFPGKFSYDYTPATREDLAGRKFYFPAKANEKFSGADRILIGDERMIGAQGSDNPGVANAGANRSFSDGSGVVWEADGSKLKPVFLSERVGEDLSSSYVEALKDIVDNPVDFVNNATHGEVLDTMWEAVDSGLKEPADVLKVQDEMKAKGYNAVIEDGSNVMGEAHRPHNLVTLLDDSAIEPLGYKSTDPEIRQAPQGDELARIARDANDPLNNTLVDRVAYQKFQEDLKNLESMGSADPLTEVDKKVNEFMEDTKLLEKTGQADPERLASMEQLQEFAKDAENWHVALKALKNCVGA